MSKRKIGSIILLAVSACSKSADMSANRGEADVSGPRVAISAVPGMSLSYQYGFRMAVERIATEQETNASQCESLGPSVCRITGMTYEVGRDRTVSASLNVKLDPAHARDFGKQAVAAVVKGGGMLVSARIDSEDSGAVIAAAKEQKDSIDAERARISKQLQAPGLGSAERQELQSELSKLAGTTRDAQAAQSEAAQKLANTPMTLTYETGEVDQTLSEGPIVGALKDGWANIISGSALIVMILVTLIPWLACVLIAGFIWSRFRDQRARAADLSDGEGKSEP